MDSLIMIKGMFQYFLKAGLYLGIDICSHRR